MKPEKNFNIPSPMGGKVKGKMSERFANICGVMNSLAWVIFTSGIAAALVIFAVKF